MPCELPAIDGAFCALQVRNCREGARIGGAAPGTLPGAGPRAAKEDSACGARAAQGSTPAHLTRRGQLARSLRAPICCSAPSYSSGLPLSLPRPSSKALGGDRCDVARRRATATAAAATSPTSAAAAAAPAAVVPAAQGLDPWSRASGFSSASSYFMTSAAPGCTFGTEAKASWPICLTQDIHLSVVLHGWKTAWSV
eukprot:CAMPEP_0179019472 /NCGR_PEP_ID=MMETSP0796-20121207/4884_1 /TAXON_ID=73915 /ORGANISM="Pyrodinium bahamense, Strain pbaha01" /LENGTH=196 /DNA_ID=CAMNT_0020715257 /DNA_START=387 /DNA_END=973 /DNA_ORIENTATION=+